jgi:hypothetical protein
MSREDPLCPLCTGTDKLAYYLSVYPILDLTEWTSKRDDKVHKWGERLLCLKQTMSSEMIDLHEEHGNLRGCLFAASRTDAKSFTTGNKFKFIKRYSEVELRKMFGKDAKSESEWWDRLYKWFTPLEKSELERVAARVSGLASQSYDSEDEKPVKASKNDLNFLK